ncbi:biosynthetic-type acetolactate synthase large subunit [Candidatus Margulisiibacteriota bacterium]
MPKINGAEIVLKVLERNGVDQIFGIPGGVVLPLYDKLYFSKIKHHLTRHEQGAVHMAQGYARVTGKVGVAFVTSGPGATNTVTGLYDAKLDSIPILVISGQVSRPIIGTDGFQEADVVGITMAATKHNDLVSKIEDLEKTIEQALIIAQEGRPGPVLIDIPKDIFLSEIDYPLLPNKKVKIEKIEVKGEFEDAARALCEAKKPLCYFGGGIINADASKELVQIIELLNLPATPTLMGLGALSGKHKNNLGMLGMHGTFAANRAMHETDCILAAGVRFDDRVTGKLAEFAPYAKVIHIEVDPAEISKIKKADWPLIGDAKLGLEKLTQDVKKYLSEGHSNRTISMKNWWETVNNWRDNYPLQYEKHPKKIKPQQIIEECYKQTKGNIIAATDVGQHQMWAAQYFPVHEPRCWVTSGGLGTMGYGLPAAIGAKFGKPDKTVIAFVGDGSFQMNIQELSSLMLEHVNVKIIIFNNGFLGMVRQWQELFFGERYSATPLRELSPDFVKIAGAYKITAKKVIDPKDLSKAISEMLKHKGPYLLDVITDEEEHVYPMVPAGAASKDMLLKKEL